MTTPSDMSSSTTVLMVETGMAKPMPSMPVALELAAFIFMLVMPTTWPCILMSGPPELPSFMAALVCRRVMEWLL